MYKVLVTDPISQNGLDILIKSNIEIINIPQPSENQLNEVIADIHGWIVRSGTVISSDDIKKAKKLQIIGRAGVGVDNIDINEATNHGIIVMNMPDGNTVSAAEHTMAMMACLNRNIQLGHLGLSKGSWDRHKLVGNELRNKFLGVIGLGRIGREVIKRALSYDMTILGYDPYVKQDMFESDKVRVVDLNYLIQNSDIITIHVPLIESTKNLFNLETFKKMKSDARLINVARGGIVNEDDLATALNSDMIGGAAIDVFENEPLDQKSSLVSAKNILLTPHLGASTFEAKEGVSVGICRQINDFLIDGKLSNPINMPFSDINKLKILKPFLDLASLMGSIQSQLDDSSIQSVSIECFGDVEDTKPLVLSFLIGLIQSTSDIKLNFINAGSIANDRGINFSHSYNSKPSNYSNLIKSKIITSDEKEYTVSGTVFQKGHSRVVEIMGFEIDVMPEGNMILMQNIDVPGVIGKVGKILGDSNINIGEFLLSRTSKGNNAFSIVKVDGKISEDSILRLSQLSEITNIIQLEL